MANEHHYVPSDWLLLCDVCGAKTRASKSRHRWDGLIVCHQDWEARHPLDFIKARSDKITVPFTRPRIPDVFVSDGAADRAINGASINSTEIN